MSNWWKTWLESAQRVISEREQQLNAMNVFPVPDADTGTNLRLTLQAAGSGHTAVESARAALLDARGNSGTLWSIWWSAVAGELTQDRDELPTQQALVEAFLAGASAMREALTEPVEGTMLSVADRLAEGTVTDMSSAVTAARQAVALTSSQLKELAGTQRVDSGALGFLYVFSVLAELYTGDSVTEEIDKDHLSSGEMPQTASSGRDSSAALEVMVSVQADATSMAIARSQLAQMGDSLSVALADSSADPLLWAVHLHTDDPGAVRQALEYAGTLSNWRTTAL
ncbi:DAK2 domain-containing protein [Rothia sp. ZJ1223]|uniref:DAK2 domain-containing protein n=1 Tax=Rothia sp. ZJ1223 TaxID=2811098 RepID=UPI00195C41BA|nr:DAK2 domain-containing protein [Rothia sp. ZJ1223]MBM7050933.1 DAK2 domain-containing protein [Rothia sp. ZJ1223]